MLRQLLITGGAGFIGSNLARYFNANGYQVFCIDDLSLGLSSNLPIDIPLIVGNVAEAQTWEQVLHADAVLHLAGPSSTPMFESNLINSFHNKLIGFLQVLEYARRTRCDRIIYASTALIYGNAPIPLREDGPIDVLNFYATSKYCMENIAHAYHLKYGMDTIGMRLMSVYGPREDHKKELANLVSKFIWDIEAGRSPLVYGDGTQTRDFTSVWDVAQAFHLALEYPNKLNSVIFNVGTGKSISLNELIEILSELTGSFVKAHYVPNPFSKAYNQHQLANLEKIQEMLNYHPSVSLRDGIIEITKLRKKESKS